MIDIRNLSIQFTGENLFENVNIKIHRKDRIALVGSNGKGKSTLLKLLMDFEKPESGEIVKQKGLRIGYLPQDLIAFKDRSLFDEVKSSLLEIHSIIQSENEILNILNSETIDDEERQELLNALGELHHRKDELNFYTAESRIEKILEGLGFKKKDFHRSTEEFSGGWQMRIQLAKILLAENDLLLLDEPTNHLDIETLQWLIEFLNSYKGAIIVVSHDRHFVNSITDKTLEVFNNQINFYPGNYEHYLNFKDERDIQLKEMQKVREKKIKETERFIERFRYKNTKAKQVQSRIKMLERMDTVELIEQEKKIEIRFPDPPRSGVLPVELKNISKSYGNLEVLKGINVAIERGEKIAIVGVNGAGKTTLAKIIGSKISPSGGEILYGHNTIISYYEQEVADSLNPENDLIDSLEEINDELTPGQIRKILGTFLFSGEDVFKKIKVLSGGEKSRVALARLLLTKSNLIILDEPTNHLDFSSKEILQKALLNFSGTMIIVSHDIDFIRPIANKIFEIRNGNLNVYYGGIDYYLNKRLELHGLDSMEDKNITKDKLTRRDQKRIDAELRNQKFILTKDLRRDLDNCEKEIRILEEFKSTIEAELADPEIFSNPISAKNKNIEYEKTKQLLEDEYNRWTELSNRLEEIEENFKRI
ncbi:MAG TPA: ABC-F family ATP-binding cassette domain-containing protein [Melioribacteraceae bacterium]|nr:ABC-F family ATP-binding cassette domain-containing protein [Melioribacteraceae bacterium]